MSSNDRPFGAPLMTGIDPMVLIEQTQDAIAFDDDHGHLVFANRAFRGLFGLADDEPLGHAQSYIAPSSRERWLDHQTRRREGRPAPTIYELEAVRRDGSRLWVEASVVPTMQDGRLLGTFTLLRDVTTRREREAELRSAQQQYRNLFEQAFEAIIVFEPEREIVLDVNRRACTLYGRSRESFIGISLVSITHDPRPGRKVVARVVRGELLDAFETIQYHADGSKLYLECNASLIDYDGQPAILTINRDVTERRRLQHRLSHAEKMEGIGQLAAGVAHEFNNVLASVLGTAEALLQETPGARAKALLRQMIARAEAGAEITRELLALSRKPGDTIGSISPDPCVRAMGGWLPPLLGGDVRVEIDTSAPGVALRMDPGQLEQIVLNLAVNARDAMVDGGQLHIATGLDARAEPWQTTTHRLPPGHYVTLTVCDTGPGIPEDAVARIFEPFYTTKEHGTGTGLGLATVYSIVDRMGGGIDVTSHGGACFVVVLPVSAEPVSAEPVVEPVEAAAEPELGHAAGSGTVLVVDDEPLIASSLARLLRAEGHEVSVAHDLGSALGQLEHLGGRLDLLLTDVSMPDGNGLELARRASEQHPGLAVLVMSGHADRGLPRELENAGFVQKPFTRSVLLHRVRRALAGRAGTRPPADASSEP